MKFKTKIYVLDLVVSVRAGRTPALAGGARERSAEQV
jgi:hypothetical protein